MKEFLNIFLKRLAHNLEGWKYVLVFMLIISYLPVAYENMVQFLSSPSKYYEYEAGNEVVISSGNKVGEYLILKSNVEYKQDIDMTWWDTLYCDGVKIDTQKWEDYMTPNSKLLPWSFKKHIFREKDNVCVVCGDMIGKTSRGYEKPFSYCTDYFNIID